jgi:Tfp pilus assembly PilM family ATPase
MLGIVRKQIGPIGIEVEDDQIQLAQLENNGDGLVLLAGATSQRPADTAVGSSKWQRWVLQVVSDQTGNGKFKGKDIAASVPSRELFIDHLKMPKVGRGKVEQTLLQKIKQRLAFPPEQAMVKYIPTEEDNVLVTVMDREKIDRHLAVYEKAGLNISSIGIWPVAVASTYTKFFGRRKTDREAVVLILDIAPAHSNLLICRHLKPLFAKTIAIGIDDLADSEVLKRFVVELNGCRRHFSSLYRKPTIERTIFLAGEVGGVQTQRILAEVAKQLELPAQMGNCMAAVTLSSEGDFVERRNCNVSWATAFGLSLCSIN